ncbi:DUF4142 domain-containing protein [Silvimonas sp.]|uniref:DUF4142 domain-containing protein n=1 Tax=Silvimonas sp. TaxID=2650811 RepID=UPI002847E173|nr:DUF4142 domain-containing protein [Silvimonas sp.]MDR3428392.1 DUF4142 domain-containing protein [Silvimonas sp.]
MSLFLTPALALSLMTASAMVDAAQSQSTDTAASPSAAASRQAKLSQQDASFMAEAQRSSTAAIAINRMALQQAEAPAIKALASKVAEDHAVLAQKLKLLAQSKGKPAATEPDAAQRHDLEQLSGLQGDHFDEAWVKVQTKACQDAVIAWSQEVANGSDQDIVNFARQTLPTLKAQLEYLQKLPGKG